MFQVPKNLVDLPGYLRLLSLAKKKRLADLNVEGTCVLNLKPVQEIVWLLQKLPWRMN